MTNTGGGTRKASWGYMGVLGGLIGVGIGTAALAGDNSQETKNLGVVNIGIGAVILAGLFRTTVRFQLAPGPVREMSLVSQWLHSCSQIHNLRRRNHT